MAISRSDPHLFSYLSRSAEELRARLPVEASYADLVRHEISTLLAHGEPRLGEVARRLAVSERTMHRRLADERTRFADLVDDARRERAVLLLEDPHLGSWEVAFLLRYGEPAAFFRAFRRWTGTSA